MKSTIHSGIFTLIFLALPVLLIASDYTIPRIDVEVSITNDGQVQIVEHRTYVFDGDFSWADYRLPKDGYTQIQSIRVSENGTDYINLNTEEEGTFSVSESDNAYIIKWYYSASDTTKTFTLSYNLVGAVSVGPQWTEFFWNYLAAGREKSTDEFSLYFKLPDTLPQDSLYIFTRDQADEFNIDYTNSGYEISGSSISRRESARIRTLFPTTLLNTNQVDISHPDLSLESILQDEESYREDMEEQARRDAFYAQITPTATIILSLLSILVFIWIYRTYGKRHSTSTLSTRETLVIPGQQPPALIGRLMMSRQTTSNHLVATLFDLARRGWFVITEQESEKEGWFSSETSTFKISMTKASPDDTLTEYERMIVDFVKQQIATGSDTFDELFDGSDSTVSKWYAKWVKEVKDRFKHQNWIDQKSYTGVTINVIAQVVLLAFAIFLLIVGTPLALAAIGIITFALIGSAFIIRRTPEGEELYKRWKAYMDGLKNADERTIRMEMLDRHFIYATALHLSKNQLKILLESSNETTQNIIPWIILTHGSTANAATVASSISTLAATGSTSFTGTTGAGTGASVGAAGGGASGGAG